MFQNGEHASPSINVPTIIEMKIIRHNKQYFCLISEKELKICKCLSGICQKTKLKLNQIYTILLTPDFNY